MEFPPGLTASDLSRIPKRLRGDAVNDAWVAHLSREDPKRAASRAAQAEYRQEHAAFTMAPELLDTLGPADYSNHW